MKLKPCLDDHKDLKAYAFFCPGCDGLHVFYVSGTVVWIFDGNLEKPSFSPSLLNTGRVGRRCHLQLTTGTIYYYPDSDHALRGTSVELPDYPW